ncbi:MAG TPA: SMC family ATPase, partial [Chthonomonadaceae bacterium]|nr:SMC family ATPase [Chthonomonadaceae bacterium]
NGKSALLDAITWALWGKTRATRTVEDDLIRLGADDMEVRFEFELNEERYRVVKKRKRGKSSEWQLTQRDAHGHYTPIGGNSQREVGKQITQLLSMEYETFLNSAYLQQGQADAFTRQTPDKRKQILGEILGLDKYEILEAKAKERWRERKELADELEREIRFLDAEAGRLPEFQAEREELVGAIAKADAEIQEQESATVQLRERRGKLDTLAQQLADSEESEHRLEADVLLREKELCAKIERLKAIQAILDQRDAILSDWERLQQNRRRREQLDPLIEEFNRKNAELYSVIGAIDAEKERLHGDLRVLKSEQSEIEKRSLEREKLTLQISALAEELKAEAGVVKALEEAQARVQEAQEAFQALRTGNERCKAELADLDEVLELLARPQAACPVCESDLSGKKHAAVVAKQQAKRALLVQEQERLKREGVAARQALTAVQEEAQGLEARRNDLRVKRSQHKQWVERRDALSAQETDVEAHRQKVRLLEARLERGEFAEPKRAHRMKLEKELEKLGLAKAEHETVLKKIQSLEGAEDRQRKLLYAEENIGHENAERERLEAVAAARRKEREAQRARSQALSAQLAQYEQVKAALAVAEADLNRLQQGRNDLRVSEGACRNAIASCERAEAQAKQKRADHKRVDQERWLYNHLMTAFGRKGVQALIIENAIPDLQEEANGLLGRITDNAMNVTFETTKIAKSSGNESETLEIKITDDLGTRPYELFSGGEAFRVNFAIRIALSRLLARRSGAKLQTLILDEGFGTQDGKGREKLVEVIEAIKDDFEKILVITHVEELKDAFTQRIEVTKDAGGSRIHLL